MATEKKPKSANSDFDFDRAVAAHSEATLKSNAWAQKALGLRAAGMTAAAEAAERKAKHWLRKMTALQVLAEHAKTAAQSAHSDE